MATYEDKTPGPLASARSRFQPDGSLTGQQLVQRKEDVTQNVDGASTPATAEKAPVANHEDKIRMASMPRSQRISIQAKLAIGAPDDKYEQEADHIANLVVNGPALAVGDDIAGNRIEKNRNGQHAGTNNNNQLAGSVQRKGAAGGDYVSDEIACQ